MDTISSKLKAVPRKILYAGIAVLMLIISWALGLDAQVVLQAISELSDGLSNLFGEAEAQ